MLEMPKLIKEFQPGTIVILKSGSLAMTVCDFDKKTNIVDVVYMAPNGEIIFVKLLAVTVKRIPRKVKNIIAESTEIQ